MREGAGLVLVGAALSALYLGVVELREHDYLASILIIGVGLAVLRAAVEFVRPSVGE